MFFWPFKIEFLNLNLNYLNVKGLLYRNILKYYLSLKYDVLPHYIILSCELNTFTFTSILGHHNTTRAHNKTTDLAPLANHLYDIYLILRLHYIVSSLYCQSTSFAV